MLSLFPLKKISGLGVAQKYLQEVCQNKLHIFVDFQMDLLHFFAPPSRTQNNDGCGSMVAVQFSKKLEAP